MARKKGTDKKGKTDNNKNVTEKSGTSKSRAGTSASSSGGGGGPGPSGPTFNGGRIPDLTMVRYGEADDPPKPGMPLWMTTKEVGSRTPYQVDTEVQEYEREDNDDSGEEDEDEDEAEAENEDDQGDDEEDEEEEQYNVETYRTKAIMNGRLFYEVKWKGWADKDNTFEFMEQLDNSLNEVKRFELSRGGLECLRFNDPNRAKTASIWHVFPTHLKPERVLAWDEMNGQCLVSWINTGDIQWVKLEQLLRIQNGPEIWREFLCRNGSRLWDFRSWEAVPTLHRVPHPSWENIAPQVLERSACPPQRRLLDDPLIERYIEPDLPRTNGDRMDID